MDPAAPWLERIDRGGASWSKREPGSYVGVPFGRVAKRGGVRSSSREKTPCLCKSSSRKRGVVGLTTSLKGDGRLRVRLVEWTANPPPVRLTQPARADICFSSGRHKLWGVNRERKPEATRALVLLELHSQPPHSTQHTRTLRTCRTGFKLKKPLALPCCALAACALAFERHRICYHKWFTTRTSI